MICCGTYCILRTVHYSLYVSTHWILTTAFSVPGDSKCQFHEDRDFCPQCLTCRVCPHGHWINEWICCCSSVAKSCPVLCNPMDYSLPGSSVHGIPQARILEWIALPFSRGFSQPRDRTWIFCTAADSLASEQPGKPVRLWLTLKLKIATMYIW